MHTIESVNIFRKGLNFNNESTIFSTPIWLLKIVWKMSNCLDTMNYLTNQDNSNNNIQKDPKGEKVIIDKKIYASIYITGETLLFV